MPGHTEWPLLRAISFKFLNTVGRVNGFGLKSVFWLFLEFCSSLILVPI